MLLESLSIRNLFGSFSYDIDFANTLQPFLMTGPNGYGKTTVLSIIDNIAKRKLMYFYQLPFESIVFRFEDEQVLSLWSKVTTDVSSNKDTDTTSEGDKEILFEWSKNGNTFSTFKLNNGIIKKAARDTGYYSGKRYDFTDYTSDDFLAFIDENDRFYDLIANKLGQKAFFMLLSNVSTTFIKAQRISFDSEKNVSSTESVVNRLRKQLRDDQFNYLNDAEQHDNTFIDRLLSTSTPYSKEEYERIANEIKETVGELKQFGLINSFKLPDFTENKSEILTAYINDVREKLGNYKITVEKLRLFSQLLENKKFVNKKVTYSPVYGLRAVSTIDGEFIDINKLSSGEQNEIIMLYNFIYNVSDNSILLIDEPENSLHVAWQNCFIIDLEEIAKTKNIQVIIATHSPQIIGARWKDSYDLFENNTQQ